MKALLSVLMVLASAAQAGELRNSREHQALRARMEAMDWWQLCTETGRSVRRGDQSDLGRAWREMLFDRATKTGQFSRDDVGPVLARRLRIGMSECAVAAALGKPNRMSQTEGIEGRSDIWGYDRRSNSIYVYFVDGAVRSWQE